MELLTISKGPGRIPGRGGGVGRPMDEFGRVLGVSGGGVGEELYLLELELRVEADVADLAVEGALGGFVWGGPCAAPQAWEGADGSQPTACLHQRLVLRPCTNTASPGDPPSPTDPSLILWDPHSLPHQFPPPQYYLMSPSSHLHLHNAPMAQQCHRTHGAPWFIGW